MTSMSKRSARQESDLWRRYHHDGDFDARAELIERLMPLVHHVARRYVNRSIDLDDLVQVGALGLVKAVDRFDPDRGLSFSSFAVPNIAGEIRRHFRDHGWALRAPRDIQEGDALVQKATDALVVSLQRQPNVREIAEYVDKSVEDVLEILAGARSYTLPSLDAPTAANDDGTTSLGDVVGRPDREYALGEDRVMIARGLTALQDRERRIIAMRFEQDLTQSEIAVELGISQMHVSRLLRQACAQMREAIGEPQLSVAPDAA